MKNLFILLLAVFMLTGFSAPAKASPDLLTGGLIGAFAVILSSFYETPLPPPYPRPCYGPDYLCQPGPPGYWVMDRWGNRYWKVPQNQRYYRSRYKPYCRPYRPHRPDCGLRR